MAKAKKKGTRYTINIKSLPVQAHIGASKYVNDDWGTIAFIIPRNQLQLKFVDPELRYNCIYFLFGFDGTAEKVYVGQAKKRNNGESVLARLREHDTSVTEKYCDIWEWAIVCTGKEDTWGLDDLNALEHAFYNEIPVEQSLNGNNPNSGGTNYDSYIDKIKQIKNYITSIGFRIFEDNEDTEKIQVTSEVNESTVVEDLQNGSARIPEIVTPHKVVKAMCDILPPEVWNDRTVFIDPACKGGEYLREIYDRLMDCEIMQVKYPDEFERSNHILDKQLYGIALSQVSLERTTKKLRGYDHNLRVIPNYIRKLKGVGLGSRPDGTPNTIRDILNEEFDREMKIDVVIGNPPYQENNGGGRCGGKPLYQEFVKAAHELGAHFVDMIIPAKWYISNKDTKEFTAWMLNNNNIRELYDFSYVKDLFNITMNSGVCFFLMDNTYQGKCKVLNCTLANGAVKILSETTRKLCTYEDIHGFKNTKTFIRDNIMLNVVKKVFDNKSRTFDTICSNVSPFGIKTTTEMNAVKMSDTELEVVKSYGEYGYIERDWITKGTNWIDSYKIIISTLNGEGLASAARNKSVSVITKPMILKPKQVCTLTYLVVGALSKMEHAERVYKYIQTKFVRALINQLISSAYITNKAFAFVPLQDFASNSDIDWSQDISDIDQQLYRKYELTQEEIDYIEKTIKPMK